ncbi:unnamed protein product [Lactuca saligna]|uniref:Urease n=1 Tax=Lactuca saligna TaxID=75948 RepID=A0AA35Z7Z5_LACSI|nr:unnamed protein product [Lactuca saligna]
MALHGSFLPVPSLEKFPNLESCKIPEELTFKRGYIMLNSGREAVVLKVTNNGDRLIQVGSHYHFIEVNPSLIFDQRKAYGMRLNIPTGTTTRFKVTQSKLEHPSYGDDWSRKSIKEIEFDCWAHEQFQIASYIQQPSFEVTDFLGSPLKLVPDIGILYWTIYTLTLENDKHRPFCPPKLDGWSVIQVNTKGAFPWKPDWHTSHITKDVVLGDYALMEMIYWCTGNDGINILHVKSIKKILNIAFSLPGISSSSFDASTSILLLPFSQTNYVKKVWISSHSFWW